MKTLSIAGFLLLAGCSNPTAGGERFVEEFGSGQKQVEGYLLDDGTKVGHWTAWHKNGQKAAEGGSKKQERRRTPDLLERRRLHQYPGERHLQSWREDRTPARRFPG